MTHRGSCHCGAVTFEADGELEHVVVCNCSWCGRTGFVHWNVDPAHFRLLTGQGALRDYQFGTRTSHNTFCGVCGVSPFRRPRSDPHLVDVNVRCLDGVDPGALPLQSFDGLHWEAAIVTRTWR
ncbi:MAG: GFA family protein [Myxococcota bacterium]